MINKKKLFILGVIAGICGLFIKLILRPFVYTYKIGDFGINGFLPSFFSVLCLCLVIAAIKKKDEVSSLSFVALGNMVYELEQIFTSRTFDYKDLIAIFLGYSLSLTILFHHKKTKAIKSDST